MRTGNHTPQPAAPVHLSMEEAAILYGEMSEDMAAVDNGLATIKEAEDITAAMTDYNTIVNIEPSITESSVAEITNAAIAMSLNVDQADVLPVVMEDFKENMKNVYQTIIELLKKLWEHIKGFYAKVYDYRSYLVGRVEKLRSQLGKYADEQVVVNPVIKLSMRESSMFATEGKELMSIDQYQKVMREILTNVSLNFERGPAAIDELGGTFIKLVQNFKPDSAHDSVKHTMVGLLQPVLWKYFDAFKVNNFSKSTIEKTGGTAVAVSPPLAGRCKVRLSWGKPMNDFFVNRDTQEPVAHVLDGLAEAKMELVSSGDTSDTAEVSTPAFSYKGLTTALDMVAKGLNLIDTLEKNQATKMRDISNSFGSVVQAKQSELDSYLSQHHEGDIPESAEEAKATFVALTKLPRVYSNLASHPINEITHRTIGTFAVILNMVEKSMPMYKLKTDLQAA